MANIANRFEMSGDESVEIDVLNRISACSEAEWDACACSEQEGGRPCDPFTTYRFLRALEDSGSVGGETGWKPLHLIAKIRGEVIATMPLYAKNNSMGEYIFDYAWAHAFMRAGGRYYPKLQSAVPFTPATGRRFLTRPEWQDVGTEALVSAARRIASANSLSSLHVAFCTEEESIAGQELGLLHRVGEQFHWFNNGYSNFEDFLSALSSRKRKNIRRERRRASEFGGRIELFTGSQIHSGHWDAFWEFYQDTGSRKWGIPYLTRSFFDEIHKTMRDDILLVMCELGGRYIAGAINFIGRTTLYGRYWGCVEDHSCLHFEVCYYRAIEYAIKYGLNKVEAGAQGPHKLARGYLPVAVHSLHWIAEPRFRSAVADFLNNESVEVMREIESLSDVGPFKKSGGSATCRKN